MKNFRLERRLPPVKELLEVSRKHGVSMSVFLTAADDLCDS